MYQSNRLIKHRKGSQIFQADFSEKTINSRAYSHEEKRYHSRIEEKADKQDIDSEQMQLKMIKKELIQFQNDLSYLNLGKKKRNIRVYKEQIEIFIHSVRYLILQAKNNDQNSHSNYINVNGEDGSITDSNKTFTQDNLYFQQSEETSIILKEQDRKILFGTSTRQENGKLSDQMDDQLNELSELIQILDECVQELNILIEYKALLKEDQLGYFIREAEYIQQIELIQERIKIFQNAKHLQEKSFQDFNQQLKMQRHQNIIYFYQNSYDSIQSQMSQILLTIQSFQQASQSIKDEYSKLIQIYFKAQYQSSQLKQKQNKREIAIMKDGFKISEVWMIELFDIEFVLNIMDKKKNKDVAQAIIKLQSQIIQEMEYLIEEKQKGCFSIYESLLKNADNHSLIQAFSDNPVLEFQQKLFQERQQKYNQLTNEKNQFILETQITLLQGFPKLSEYFNKFTNLIGNINQIIIENENNQNLTILFKLLHNQFKEKISNQYSQTQTLDNYFNLASINNQIEKHQMQLNDLDIKATSFKSVLNQLKLAEESLIKACQTKITSPNKQSFKIKFDILEDAKVNFQARNQMHHAQCQEYDKNDNDQGFYQAEDRKKYIQQLLDDKNNRNGRQSSNNKQTSIEKSPNRSIYSTRQEEQWSLNSVENHEEYQLEKSKKICILLIEEIMELDLKRETNNFILGDTVQKEMRSLFEKQKFIASSIYRTLKLIKFKFEQIHLNQQSSLQNISSFRMQSKTSVDERDRVILQLFGEANLLCCDYESNFYHEYNTSISDQLSSKLMSSGDAQKIQHSNRSIYQRSQSAGKMNNNYNSNTQIQKLSSKPQIINIESSSNHYNLNIQSHKNIYQQKQSPDDKTKKMKKCQSFVESQIQRILSSQKSISSKASSTQNNKKQFNKNDCLQSISPNYNINTTNKPSYNLHQQKLDLYTQQNNICKRGSDSSLQNIPSPHSIQKQNQFVYNNPIQEKKYINYEQNYSIPKVQSPEQLCNKLRSDLSNTSTFMCGSPNITKKLNQSNTSQHSINSNSSNTNIGNGQALKQTGKNNQIMNKIGGSSQQLNQIKQGSSPSLNNISGQSQTQIQNCQILQQQQEINRNKYNNNSMHNCSQTINNDHQILQNQNFQKKLDTVKIGQFLNNNNSFLSNQQFAPIKNIIKSPKSQTDQNSSGYQSTIHHNKNYNLAQNQFQQIIQPHQNIIKNRSLHEIKKLSVDQPRIESVNQLQKQVNLDKENIFQQPNQSIQNQEHLNNITNQKLDKPQCSLNNSILCGKPKFGVVQIDINKIEQKQKESLLCGSSSTIEQEQTNINLSKINSTFNKNMVENGLMLLEGEDFVKFSFSNNINCNSIINSSNKHNDTQMKQQKNNHSDLYQNIYKDLLNMNSTFNTDSSQTPKNIIANNNKSNSQLSSTQDKENIQIQPTSCSKEPKLLKENINYRKLNNILFAATVSKGIDINKNSISNNHKRATASKYPQCKSPLSRDTSIYEGSNEMNSNQLESINSNFQTINKMISANSNCTIYDMFNQTTTQKNLSQTQLNLIDLELGISVYIRFNNQTLLKKRVFDPLTMNIKDAINLGYVLRIMKFNKELNRLEFYRERNSLSKHLNYSGNSSYSICSNKQNSNKNDQSEYSSVNNISENQEKNLEDKRIILEKCLLLPQIKKIQVPSSTSCLYKCLNNQSNYSLPNNVHIDQKQLLKQNNFLLCIDSKDSGLTEIIINTMQTYQSIYTSLSSIFNTQTL